MSYLNELHPKEADSKLASLRVLAEQQNIPIIETDTARFLRQLLTLKQPARILEIGTAIGYTASLMAKALTSTHITTIERNPDMVKLAKKHIEQQHLTERITLIEGDALTLNNEHLPYESYDLLFIDAAKAQNINFFEKYESLLPKGGIILVDNIYFHGMIEKDDLSKNLRQLMRKVDAFNRYVLKRTDYDSALYHVGDGLCMAIKK